MKPLKFIDQIKDMYNDQEPRSTIQGPRNMYAGGQLVRNTVDGSRPGYQGPDALGRIYEGTRHLPIPGKQGFQPTYHKLSAAGDKKLIREWKKSLTDAVKAGDMSETVGFQEWLRNKFDKKKANTIRNRVRLQLDFFPGKEYNNIQERFANSLIKKHNEADKLLYSKEEIFNKLRLDRNHGLGKKLYTQMGDSDIGLENLDTKINKAFNKIVDGDLPIKASKKVTPHISKYGPITQMIAEISGAGSTPAINNALEKNPKFKNKEFAETFKYLNRTHAKDFIGMPFNEAFEYAKYRQGGLDVKGMVSYTTRYQNPESNIMSFAVRHTNRHFRDGTKSQIQFYKLRADGTKGALLNFKDLPKNRDGNRVLDLKKVGFEYKNQFFHRNNLKTKGFKSGLFDEVYSLSGKNRMPVPDPNNPSQKINLKKLLQMTGDKLTIGHDEALGGVKGAPFKNLRIQGEKLNTALFNAYDKIQNKDLRRLVLNQLEGQFEGLSGGDYEKAFVEGKVDEAKKAITSTDTLYRGAGRNIIEGSPEWMKWSSRKQAELFRVAGVSAKDFNALNNAKPNEKISMLKKMGFKCRMSGGAGESVDCYMKDVGETNKLAKQGNKQAIKKLGNAFDIGKELPKMGKILRQGLQIGLAGPANLLKWSGLGTWGGLLLEGAVEGGIYKYYKDYKGLTHDQALAETFTPGLLAGRPEGVPWYGGSEALQEKELYEVKDEAGNVVGTKQNVKDFIDTQRNMDQIGTEYDKLESQKRDINEMRGYASQYVDTDYAHPRLDPRVGIENKQKALENEYLKLEQLNKPDALTGNYNAWLTAKEKQDTEQGLRAAEAKKKRLGVVDIPWDVLNPNEMQRDYKLKKYERAQDRWEKEQSEKRYRQMREQFPGYSDNQIDEILEYYETSQPEVGRSYGELGKMFDIGDKQAYYADNFRMEKAGGGMVGIRKPDAIAPTGGPQSQGLASTPEYDTYSKEYKWQI